MQSRTKRVWSGTIAQLVEQRTENPCVAGSIPAGTTKLASYLTVWGFFDFWVQNWVQTVDFRFSGQNGNCNFSAYLERLFLQKGLMETSRPESNLD